MSKHDVKVAFLNAKMPEGRIVSVAPPDQWVRWGIVEPGPLWILDKAVHGLRESPALWVKERDERLAALRWQAQHNGKQAQFRLHRSVAGSQVWKIVEDNLKSESKIYGLLVVYVGDFLLQAAEGDIRSQMLDKIASFWTLAKEASLTRQMPLTFLGIEIEEHQNGDVILHQRKFVESLSKKHGLDKGNGNKAVYIHNLPADPSPPDAATLQGFSGEFNWLGADKI